MAGFDEQMARWNRREAERLGFAPCGSSREAAFCVEMARRGIDPTNVRQQFGVGNYRLDFAWPDYRVAVEIDGPHHQQPDRAAFDACRDDEMAESGWMIWRCDAYDDERMAALSTMVLNLDSFPGRYLFTDYRVRWVHVREGFLHCGLCGLVMTAKDCSRRSLRTLVETCLERGEDHRDANLVDALDRLTPPGGLMHPDNR